MPSGKRLIQKDLTVMKILIKNGRVIDPANRIDSVLNLLTQDNRISAILPPGECPPAELQIDASGMVVAPGFIDIHMHEDPPGSPIPQSIFLSMLRMGVTTAVAGNCGDNLCDPVHYLDLVDSFGTAVNVAMFAGHTWFRHAAGQKDNYAPVTPGQIRFMKDHIREALAKGCIGISFGLRYVPGMTTDEFLEIASCARAASDSGSGKRMQHSYLVAAHVRDDADYIFDAVDEFVQAGFLYHLPLEISHIGSMGGFGQMKELLARLDSYRSRGLDVMADCYPYDAFCTQIGASTYDNGWMERYHCDYGAVEMCSGKYRGMRCTKEMFEEMRRTDPGALTICYVMQPDDIRTALSHPNVMVGSDGILDQGQGHPRAAGTFPRFLARYTGSGALSLYDATAKITALPAKRLALPQKGNLGVGSDADIVVFNPDTICDCATFEEPLLAPEGIRHVIIGGLPALSEGKIVSERSGRSVRPQKTS